MNAFTKRKVAEGRALYVAMCKGKIAQRGIHKTRNGKKTAPIIGGGFAYHGHANID